MTPPVQVERRAGQRFPFVLPVSLRGASSGLEGVGLTQDLSSRGVFFFTEAALREGDEIELSLNMPSEITLGDNMRVRCRGHVLRVLKPVDKTFFAVKADPDRTGAGAENKIGVAVRLEGYEYLPDLAESGTAFPRVSALHSQHKDDRLLPVQSPARPVLG
jgi:hypothetical protein